MKRGPKPKAIKERLQAGNVSHRPIDSKDVAMPAVAAALVPKPPIPLDGHASWYWDHHAPRLAAAGLLTEVDLVGLAIAAQEFDEMVRINEQLGGLPDSFVTVTENGNVVQHPLVGVRNKAKAELRRWMAEYGLTPASRASIKIPRDDAPADPIEARLTEKAQSRAPSRRRTAK